MWRSGIAAAVAVIAVVGCNGEKKAPAVDTTAAAAPKPAQTDFTKGGPYLFVSNEDGNDVTVINAKTDSVVATLDPGQRPRGVRVSPDGKWLIVAVSGSPKAGPGVDEKTLPPADRSKDGIALIDLSTGKKVANLPGGLDPEAFAISSDGKTIYVSNEDGGTLTLIDVDTRQITGTVPIGSEPEGVQIHPDNKVLYATNEGSGTVSVLDLKTKKIIATFPTGKRPRGIAFTPDGKKAYITNEVGGTVTVVDAKKHKVIKNLKIPGDGAKPMGTAMAPDGEHLYITTGRGGTAVVIDTKNDSVGTPFPVGKRPWGSRGERGWKVGLHRERAVERHLRDRREHGPGGEAHPRRKIAVGDRDLEVIASRNRPLSSSGCRFPRSVLVPALVRIPRARAVSHRGASRAGARDSARSPARRRRCARRSAHARAAACAPRVARVTSLVRAARILALSDARSCDRRARKCGDTRPASSCCARSRGAPPDTRRDPNSFSRARSDAP